MNISLDRKDAIIGGLGGTSLLLVGMVIGLFKDKYKNHKHTKMLQEKLFVLTQERDNAERELAKERFYNRRHRKSY